MPALGKGRGRAPISPPTLINTVMVNLLKTRVDLGGFFAIRVCTEPMWDYDGDNIS